jgi:hypothetical protein
MGFVARSIWLSGERSARKALAPFNLTFRLYEPDPAGAGWQIPLFLR